MPGRLPPADWLAGYRGVAHVLELGKPGVFSRSRVSSCRAHADLHTRSTAGVVSAGGIEGGDRHAVHLFELVAWRSAHRKDHASAAFDSLPFVWPGFLQAIFALSPQVVRAKDCQLDGAVPVLSVRDSPGSSCPSCRPSCLCLSAVGLHVLPAAAGLQHSGRGDGMVIDDEWMV